MKCKQFVDIMGIPLLGTIPWSNANDVTSRHINCHIQAIYLHIEQSRIFIKFDDFLTYWIFSLLYVGNYICKNENNNPSIPYLVFPNAVMVNGFFLRKFGNCIRRGNANAPCHNATFGKSFERYSRCYQRTTPHS